MKREEKSEKGLAEKEENLGEKLSRRLFLVRNSRGGGPSTPLSSWKLYHPQSQAPLHDAAVSARKLAASIWEFNQYFPHHQHEMHRVGGVNKTNSKYNQRRHNILLKDKGIDLSDFLADPCSSSDPDQPESASSLRRHIAQTLMKQHRLIEKVNHAVQPVSPASNGSSMEVAPYNPAVTPCSSLDFRGRIGKFKTSTELIKVLNRIWSLEEQRASNVSLIKALKMEVDHVRGGIKALLQDRQSDQRKIDELIKQVAEDKPVTVSLRSSLNYDKVRKSREQDRIYAALQSVRDELDSERELRKHSESLHRKLAQELSEAKASFSNALKDLEQERKSRKLLEDLCDQLARGIKSYEQELHTLRQKTGEEWAGVADHDHLILHMSESWLDERMQMKLEEAQSGFAEQNSIVDRLGFEIETFLQAQQIGTSVSKHTDCLSRRDRKSLDSVLRNEAINAAKDVRDEVDSAGSDFNCFELNKPGSVDLKSHEDEVLNDDIKQIMKSNQIESKPSSHEKPKSRHPSRLQVKFEEKMARAIFNGNKKSQLANSEQEKTRAGNTTEIEVSQKLENNEATEYGSEGRKNKRDEMHGLSSNYALGTLTRNHELRNDCGEASCSLPPQRNRPCPAQQLMTTKYTPPILDVSESCEKLPPGTKDNTLKAKLLEARSRGQRSRLKIFKGKS